MSEVKAGQAYIELTAHSDDLKNKLVEASGEMQSLAAEMRAREKDFKVELTAKTDEFKSRLADVEKSLKAAAAQAAATEKRLQLELKANTTKYEQQLKEARKECEKLEQAHKKTADTSKNTQVGGGSGGGKGNAAMSILAAAAEKAYAALKKVGQYVWNELKEAFAAAVKYVKEAVSEFAAFGDQINKMSSRTGMSAEFLSQMKYVSEMNGAGIEKVEDAVKGLQAVLAGGDADKKLQQIGLSVDQLAGKSAEEKFLAVTRGIASINDPTKRAGVAMQLMGESARSLMPMMDMGAVAFDNMRAKANELGVVLTDEAAAGGAALTDAITDMKTAGKGLKLAVGQIFADEFKAGAERCKTILVEIRKWLENNKEVIMGWIRGFRDLADTIKSYVLQPLAELAGLDFSGVRTLSRELNQQMEATKQLHEQDAARFKIVEQLAKKESLTNEELNEASAIVSDLETKYGKIGIAIDTNTRKITVQADAQKKLGEAMKQKQLADVAFAIAGQKDAVDKSKDELEKATKRRKAAQGQGGFFMNPLDPNSWKSYDTLMEEEKRAKRRLQADTSMLRATEQYQKDLQVSSGEKVVEDGAKANEEREKKNKAAQPPEEKAKPAEADKYKDAQSAIDKVGEEITKLVEQIAEKKLKGEDASALEKTKQGLEIDKAKKELELASKQRADAKAAEAAAPETATEKEKEALKKKVQEANQKWVQAAERLGQLAEGVDREAKQAAEKAKREADAEAKKKKEKKPTKKADKIDEYDEQIAEKKWAIAQAKGKGKDTKKLESELETLELKQAIAQYKNAEEAHKQAKIELEAAKKKGDSEAETEATSKVKQAQSDMASAAGTASSIYDRRRQDAEKLSDARKKQAEKASKEIEEGKNAITVKTGSSGSMSAWGLSSLFGTDYQQQIAQNTRTQIQTLKNIEKYLKNNNTKYA